jgi:prepilin-type N-terminal cleavage/methylation domain-containing protein
MGTTADNALMVGANSIIFWQGIPTMRLIKWFTTQGFTLTEVLAGILLVAIFTSTALQAMVMSTAIKVKAQEASDATAWMQEDLEWIRSEASRLDKDMGADVTRCGARTAAQGYGEKLRAVIDKEPPIHQQSFTKRSPMGQRSYLLNRTVLVSSTAPFNTLAISYTVTPRDKPDEAIAQLYAEVVPEASLTCP